MRAEAVKNVVVVLGMARSGTSLACQALAQMGVSFGDPAQLLGPNHANPFGRWEHVPLKNKQSEITERNVRIAGYLFRGLMPDFEDPEGEAALVEMLSAEVARCRLFGLKEPMIARLLPMWERIFASSRVSPIYVVCLREPEAIYRSLLREGVAFQQGNPVTRREIALIWAEYVHAMARVEGPRLWYDDWITDEANQLRLLGGAVGWSGPMPRVCQQELLHA